MSTKMVATRYNAGFGRLQGQFLPTLFVFFIDFLKMIFLKEPFRTRLFHERNYESDRGGFFIFMPGA
jgi:hypothetical protein